MPSIDEQLVNLGSRWTQNLTEERSVEESLAKCIVMVSQASLVVAMEASNHRFENARAESNERFELARAESDRRFELALAESDRRFANFRSEMLQRFDQVDAQVDARFDKVDNRLDSLTERVAALESNFKAFRPRILLAIGSTLVVAMTAIANFDKVWAFLSTLGS